MTDFIFAMSRYRFVLFIILLGYSSTTIRAAQEDDTLVLVHVLHRHGDRAPDNKIYKNNPISNDSFYQPYGYGELYVKGKTTAYKIGVALRQKYNRFLGDIYTVKYIEARTTNTGRTKTSLLLVLGGLWPPKRDEKFWNCLNWQPIPYNYYIVDKEISGTNVCPLFASMRDDVINSNTIQSAISQYNDVFDYVSNHTGEEFKTTGKIFDLFLNLQSQEAYGYPVEEWLKPIYPDILERITVDQYYIETNTTDLQKITSGFLLRKIINDSKAKLDGLLVPQQRKMFIYSAHERNLAHMLVTLGIFNEKVPPFGAYILYELHFIEGVYGFKIYYQDWTANEPKLMILPGCQEFCPYENFVALFADVLPDDNLC